MTTADVYQAMKDNKVILVQDFVEVCGRLVKEGARIECDNIMALNECEFDEQTNTFNTFTPSGDWTTSSTHWRDIIVVEGDNNEVILWDKVAKKPLWKVTCWKTSPFFQQN